MAYSPIAIVGRACLLPQASSPTALWELVANKRSAITAVPAGRFGLDPDLVRGTPGNAVDRTWSTRGGYVDVDVRDLPDFPGRKDVAALDPLFSWTLSTTHQALVDAGMGDGVLTGERASRAGFIFGNLSFPTEGMTRLGETLALDDAWRAATGRSVGDVRDRFMSGLPAQLVTQHLGLKAFSFCLDAACASSLYAIHLAARALQDRRVDVVVAGAVNRADSLFLHIGFSALQALSTSGTPRPFDRAADGLVPAEGSVALTLMRLDDAVAEGRTVHGVITGSGVSNDGRSKSLLAPSSEGQVRALQAAWSEAERAPSSAQLFECHATGTQAGDKTEVASLAEVVGAVDAPLPLSSLKSNLGHLITAAGAAGLLKVCEALRHEQLPPSIHVNQPLDALQGSLFCVQQELTPWVRPTGDVRRAGVSAFGFGGNNAHVVVEEPPRESRTYPSAAIVHRPLPTLAVVALGTLCGETRGGLDALTQSLAQSQAQPQPLASSSQPTGAAVVREVVVDTDGVRFPPNDLKVALAQQLLVFEAARDAAGTMPPEALPRDRTGIFIGMGADMAVTTPGLRWRAEHLAQTRLGHAAVDADTLRALRDLAMPPMAAAGVLGTMPNIPANRLSVQLDLRGAAFTVSAEEHSGLAALDVARALIAAGELDAAFVGAVDAAADARHQACIPGATAADAAVVLVVMTSERAQALGLSILGTLDDAPESARATWSSADVKNTLGSPHTALDLLATATALTAAGDTVVETTAVAHVAPRRLHVRTSATSPVVRDDVAFLFGPVTPTRSLAQPWLAFPAVRRSLDEIFHEEAPALLRGERGASGSERDLFLSSASTQARFAFARHVLGLQARHYLGVSLGESNALVAAGIWPDPLPVLADTIQMRLFTQELGGLNHAVAALWAERGRADLGNAWATVCARAPRARVMAELDRRDDVFATVWHHDDEVILAGAPDGIAAVSAALQITPIVVQDAPAVHVPAVRFVADRYRALNHRPVGQARAVVWSTGVGEDGGPIENPTSDACADAIVNQAIRVVDVPVMLRKLWACGVRTFVDVSPRGLVAQWATVVLPEANVVAVEGEPALVAARFAELGLGSKEQLARFSSKRAPPARPLRVPAHQPPRPWPAPVAATPGAFVMPTPPRRPRVVPADLAGDVAWGPTVGTAPSPTGSQAVGAVNVALPVATSPTMARAAHRAEMLSQAAAPSPLHHLQEVPPRHAAVEAAQAGQRERVDGRSRDTVNGWAQGGNRGGLRRVEGDAPDLLGVDARTGGTGGTVLSLVGAQQAALAQAHQSFLATAHRAHEAFLQSRQRSLANLVSHAALPTVAATPVHDTPPLRAGAPAAPPPAAPSWTQATKQAPSTPSPRPGAGAPTQSAAPPRATAGSAFALAKTQAAAVSSHATPSSTPHSTAPQPLRLMHDRNELLVLASQKISEVWGPMFARQDDFSRQVRMPMPPLLLCDRVLSTTATPGKLEKGKQIVTATDVRVDAWYLHEGRVPAGVLIETGQADLLLISLMGVDFENRGERVYRLLGCDLTYTGPLPRVGDVLVHDIVIDGFATAAISATSEARIFFFHSETRLNAKDGPLVLQVKNGQAGFFTDEELAHSGGILWKPQDEKRDAILALPHDGPLLPTTKTSLSRADLLAFSLGDAFACFGAGFEMCQTHVRTPRIDPPRETRDAYGNPDGRFVDLLLIDRVTELTFDGGPWGRGFLRAELDLSADKWFYEGHFKDDPCMPGTIMFQGCLQVASTYLASCGYTVSKDGFRFEPKLMAEMPLRCRGQATPSSKKMVYELFVKSVTKGMSPSVHCDILVTVDGLKSLHCKDVIVALVPDGPVTSRPDLLGLVAKADGKDGIAPRTVAASDRDVPVTGFSSVLATGIGRPGLAFPGLYDVYDDGSPVARMPGPPYHFMSHIDGLRGPPMGSLAQGQNPSGTQAVVRYDVPDDAWYFDEAQGSQGGTMPFAVLLEVALQPCGWLSSFVGSTRTAQEPLMYRNLDGRATLHAEVRRAVGALLTTATLTKSSSSGGMIIQEFTFETRAADGTRVFSGNTVFGFFPALALARQVGVGSTDEDKARLREKAKALCGVEFPLALGLQPARFFEGSPRLPPAQGAPTLLMVDRIEGAFRNERGFLRVRTAKDVVLSDWFFRAHFFGDPVQPGSLGIEAMIQALQWACIADDVAGTFGLRNPRFESLATGAPLTWKYRGQVVPKNQLIQVEVDVVDVTRDNAGVVVMADGALWVDGLRIYLAKGLAVRLVET
jgi:acyl transferase domain-containing protein/3-hydroxymyristoyl/3-hydroxydecanoyl-(acyl carrier protein) dehydratase